MSNRIEEGDKVIHSPIGERVVTEFNGWGFPEVDGSSCPWLIREDVLIHNPRGYRIPPRGEEVVEPKKITTYSTKITIECGETTCASEPGKFCKFLGTKSYGTKSVCMFFRDEGDDEIILYDSPDGWVRRCPQCLETFKKEG